MKTILFSLHFNGLEQERPNSSASAMELRLSCTNPSIWSFPGNDFSQDFSPQFKFNGNYILLQFNSSWTLEMPWEHSFCVMCKILLWFLYKNLDQTPKFPSNLNFNRKTFSEMALSFSLEVPHKLHSQQVCVIKDIPSEIPNSWKFVDVKMLCQSHPSNTHTDAHAQRVNGVSAYAKLHCDAVREYLSKIAEQDDYWNFFRKSSVIVKQSLTRPWLPAYMTLHTFMDCLWAPWHTPTVAICPALTPYWNPWI